MYLISLTALNMVLVLLSIWITGWAIERMFVRYTKPFRYGERFFTGLLAIYILAVVVNPITERTRLLSLTVWSILVAFNLSVWIYFFKRDRWEWSALATTLTQYWYKRWRIVVASVAVALITFSLVGTHNLGFDDTAHIDYLDKVFEDGVFQEFQNHFKDEVGNWKLARYPGFGLLVGTVGCLIPGGSFFVYYILGFLILVNFLILLIGLARERSMAWVHVYLLMCISILVLFAGGYDNFFNYGFYPLNQGKLLIMAGVFCLIFNCPPGQSILWHRMVLGAGLLGFGAFQHLNLIFLYAASAGGVAIYLFFRGSKKEFFMTVAAIAFFPSIIAMTALLPESFVVWEKKTAVANGTLEKRRNDVRIPKEPTVKKQIVQMENRHLAVPRNGLIEKSMGMLKGLQRERYRNAIRTYLSRSLSFELLLLIAAFALALRFRPPKRVALAATIVVALGVILSTGLISARQAIACIYRPGSAWMVWDLAAVPKDGMLLTDRYTELYGRAIYGLDVNNLPVLEETALIYPFLKTENKKILLSSLLTKYGSSAVLLNGRYWGLDQQDFMGIQRRTQDAGLVETFKGWTADGDLSRLKQVLGSVAQKIKNQHQRKLVTISNADFQTHDRSDNRTQNETRSYSSSSAPIIFRDAIFRNVVGLAADSQIEIDLKHLGAWVYVGILDENMNFLHKFRYRHDRLNRKIHYKLIQTNHSMELSLADLSRERVILRNRTALGNVYVFAKVANRGHFDGFATIIEGRIDVLSSSGQS